MMQTISVRFFARKDRATDDGLIPVSMRIGLNREHIAIPTKIHVKESEWLADQGRIAMVSRQARLKNEQLEA
ncbi:MAG TPA: Arm DNA-binding domain-containing protein, partial [Cyclobacteriaceae bacterium]|nr:Arm DNA-binding domain-containing protein [Cyclobacteriaceae bacterium]